MTARIKTLVAAITTTTTQQPTNNNSVDNDGASFEANIEADCGLFCSPVHECVQQRLIDE
jgi:hypothetical protein